MADVVSILRAELDILGEDVRRLATEQERVQAALNVAAEKADKIRATLAVYERNVEPERDQPKLFPAQEGRPRFSTWVDPFPINQHWEEGMRPGSKAYLVKSAVAAYLHQKGPTHRNELLEMLIQRGIMGHEKTPIASLAAYLSDFRDVFESAGRGIFRFRNPDSKEPPPADISDAGTVEAAHPGPNPEHAFNPQLVEDERKVVHDNMT